MKSSRGKTLILAVAAVMMVPSALWAAGPDTNAGTAITNSVLLSWDAGQSLGNTTSGTASFVVDRNVIFTNVASPGATVDLYPGDDDALVEFDLVNTTNGPLDLLLSLPAPANAPSAYNLLLDSDSDNACTGTDLAANLPAGTYLDEVPEDATRTVCLYVDAPSGAAQATTYYFTLTAQAGEPGSVGAGAALVNGNNAAWQAGTVQNAFGDAAGSADVAYDGLYSAFGHFRVVRAVVSVTKVITGIVDTAGYTTVPKAIPGATVSYRVVVGNSGQGAAQNVSLTDTLSAAFDAVGGGYVNNVNASTGVAAPTDNTPDPDTILWTIGTVAPASSENLTYDLTIP